MTISDLFTAVIGGDSYVHYECRNCGRNLAPPVEQCPNCGGGISRYELE